MTAHVGMPRRLEMLTELAADRAVLVRKGVLDLHESVDGLQFLAQAIGLVEAIGQDTVQRLIAGPLAHRSERRAAA